MKQNNVFGNLSIEFFISIFLAIGVNIEHIEAFHMKWKTSSKSHG